MLLAVDFTVLVFSTNGHATQDLLQGLVPFMILFGLKLTFGTLARINLFLDWDGVYMQQEGAQEKLLLSEDQRKPWSNSVCLKFW